MQCRLGGVLVMMWPVVELSDLQFQFRELYDGLILVEYAQSLVVSRVRLDAMFHHRIGLMNLTSY